MQGTSFALKDLEDYHELTGRINITDNYITLHFDGYGTKSMFASASEQILIEFYGGELRLIVWADKDQEDPTHIISLEDAKIVDSKLIKDALALLTWARDQAFVYGEERMLKAVKNLQDFVENHSGLDIDHIEKLQQGDDLNDR